MSQQPPPYSHLPYAFPGGYRPYPDRLAPVRRASLLLIILGVLMLLGGGCAKAVEMALLSYPRDQLMKMMAAQPLYSKFPPPPGVDIVEASLSTYRLSAIIGASIGPILILMGIVVRRANRTAIVLSIAVCLSLIVVEVASGAMSFAGSISMATSACVGFVPTIVLIMVSVWLIQMLNALPKIESERQQWLAYSGGQPQPQTYGQPMWGPAPPPPPPPPGVGGYNPGSGPTYGAPPPPPPGAASNYGYGAIAPTRFQDPANPAQRHPPLPPDSQDKPPMG